MLSPEAGQAVLEGAATDRPRAPIVAFVKSDADSTFSGAFGLAFTAVRLSLLQAVRPATNDAAASDALRNVFRIII